MALLCHNFHGTLRLSSRKSLASEPRDSRNTIYMTTYTSSSTDSPDSSQLFPKAYSETFAFLRSFLIWYWWAWLSLCTRSPVRNININYKFSITASFITSSHDRYSLHPEVLHISVFAIKYSFKWDQIQVCLLTWSMAKSQNFYTCCWPERPYLLVFAMPNPQTFSDCFEKLTLRGCSLIT